MGISGAERAPAVWFTRQVYASPLLPVDCPCTRIRCMPPPTVPVSSYDQHLEVETPENVVLDFEIAGMGSRLQAAIVDMLWIILGTLVLAIVVFLTTSLGLGSTALQVLLVLAVVLGFWAYFTFFEALREGQTPGKRAAGIRVVRDTGHPVTLAAAAVRNLLRAVDLFPPTMLVDVLLVVMHPKARRLGDLVAGTIVVRDRPVEAEIPETAAPAEEEIGPPELDDAEFRILREFMERAPSLTPELRNRFAGRLADRFVERFHTQAGTPFALVSRMYQLELSRRRSRFATTRRGAGGIAERFVARKITRWSEFRALADRAARRGLDSLEARELPDFAARYREVAADLARARTYRAPAPVRHQLERMVAAGHNALYRDERRTGARIWEIVMRECPALRPARDHLLRHPDAGRLRAAPRSARARAGSVARGNAAPSRSRRRTDRRGPRLLRIRIRREAAGGDLHHQQ